MVWPPATHQDVYDELENAQGWAQSLEQRLEVGELTIRAGGPLWVPGRYISSQITTTSGTALTVSANRLYLTPIYFAKARAVDEIGIQVSTSGTGTIRMGVYNTDPETCFPTTPLLDGGTPVSSSTTGNKVQPVSGTLHGMYWLATTCTAGIGVTGIGVGETPPVAGSPTRNNAPANHIYTTHAAASALPDLTSATLTYATGTVPATSLRAI